MKKKSILLWGDVCIDHNDIQGVKMSSPGGSAFYCSKILAGLGWNPVIISPRGKDYNTDWLQEIPIYPEKPQTEKTLVYKNIYNQKGERTLYAENRESAFFIDPSQVPDNYVENALGIIICPIDNNIPVSSVKKLREKVGEEKILACLPQGFFRRYTESGEVYQEEWNNDQEIVPLLDFIILSEEDGKNLDKKARAWSKLGSVVVITRAEKGCSVFQGTTKTDFPAFKIDKVIDPVGAGDVFSAAFVYSYLKEKSVKKAARFANATAGLSLNYHAEEMNISKEKVDNFLNKYVGE